MNYYIQGDAANADKIKAAFEKLGYDISRPGGCANPDVINIGVERNGAKYVVAETAKYIRDIIKTHPDYKELELPVESKFNVGDWIVRDYDGFTKSIESLKDGNYYFNQGSSFPIKGIDEYYHPWTIQDAKDGDVLVNDAGCIFINAGFENDDKVTLTCYCYVSVQGVFYEEKHKIGSWLYVSDVHPATKEQRDLLFKKMKEAGYQWDAGKKELRKIKTHYDIDNFKPKQWVLVRDDDEWEWTLTRFSHLSNGSASLFVCINGASFQQCIPFEDNEKLLGTTDKCDEQYINW